MEFIIFYFHGDKYLYCVQEMSYRTVQSAGGYQRFEGKHCLYCQDGYA
jgi:hypothetical protein